MTPNGGQQPVPVDTHALDRELALRGWSKRELATHAQLAPETIARLYRSQRCGLSAWRRILAALRDHPPLEGAARLLRER